jgi:DNA-binding transcriptional regulator PaaX
MTPQTGPQSDAPDKKTLQKITNLQLSEEKLRQELLDLRRPYLFRNPQLLTALITTIGAGFGLYLLVTEDYFKVREQRNAFQEEQTKRLNVEAKAAKDRADEEKQEAAAIKAQADATKAEAQKTVSDSNRKIIAAGRLAAAAIKGAEDLELEVASRELASKAEEQLPDNPTAARDLAIDAWKRKHTKYARKALVDAYSMPVLELEGYTAAFSPDGHRLATVGHSGRPQRCGVDLGFHNRRAVGRAGRQPKL